MMPARKSTYTGIVKDEGTVISLNFETGGSLILNMNGFNPDADRAALLPFVGKRVEVDGVVPPRSDNLIIGDVSAIKVLGKPKRTPRAPKP